MVEIRYIGPGMAVVAGKALWSGETRMVSRKIAEKLDQERPGAFEISEVGLGETVSTETKAGKTPAPFDPADIKPKGLAALTVEQLRDVAAATADVEYLVRLLELEKAGKGRKTAIEAFEGRISELQSPPGEPADGQPGESAEEPAE
jgi:hypothetical protein